MGVVYKAEDTRLGRIVALKFLNTELLSNESVRRRFLHEARAASSIDHPNVCHVYEVGDAEGRTYMAMNYCEGRSLRDVIKAGTVAPREAFSIAFGIAQGLWAAHRRGIVHRDIKPANVILTEDEFVRIVDRCLEKDPEKRYPTVEALLEDMVSVAHELGWESSVASATIAPILRERRRRVLTRRVGIGVAAVAIVAGSVVAWHFLHVRSPYTTDVRLAVMPLSNLIGADNNAFVDGLSEHLSRVARGVSLV